MRLPKPSNIQKYLYIEKTPNWKVKSIYLYGILSWLLVAYGYFSVIGVDPVFTFFVTPIIFFLTIYHLASFGLNLFYQQFNLKEHLNFVREFWSKTKEQPSVDIFLPICGEETEVLENTWWHVFALEYKNKKVYVLDDSKEGCEEHKKLAHKFGFTYFERPNKGEMKKAGNLKYGYERSKGEFIVIFDADFAPHKDFITETLPYMSDPEVGIVQTPQYFETTKESFKASPLAYCAAYAEEPFYRFIQVTRNRFKGPICCGSNAVYRRVALDKIGGPYQIDYSEDAHTGFAITCAGYRVFYIPILLAIGMCPDNHYSFFHQQHRWSMGSMRLMLSEKFWKAPLSWKTKFCYITGFMFYLHHPFVILFSFHLFWVLFLYNEFIPQGSGLLYYPHLLFAIWYLWLFPIAKFKIGYFGVLIARTYAYSHAVFTAFLRKSVGWVSTNAKHSSISPAFRQTVKFVSVYLFIYLLLVAVGLRTGDIHLFNKDYWSIQFWIFYNLALSGVLFFNLTTTARVMTAKNSPTNDLLLLNKSNISSVSQNTAYYELEAFENNQPDSFDSFAKNVERVGGHIILGTIFALTVINIGFILGINITVWSLPVSYLLYVSGLLLFKLIKKESVSRNGIAGLVLLPLVFFVIARLIGLTFDSSHDGQDYHSGAVIALANGWNPWKTSDLPVRLPDAVSYIVGFPKSLWTIQAGIYTLTQRLNSATITNLAVALIASIFVYGALSRLKVPRGWAVLITILAVLEANFIQQFFTFMADGFGYQISLIAISSLIMLMSDRDKKWPVATFLSAEILLIGSKFSNLANFGVLGLIFLVYIIATLRKNAKLVFTIAPFLMVAVITLWVPYGQNLIERGSPLYPSNLGWPKEVLINTNIPLNLKNENPLSLLLYGIYSKAQKAGAADDAGNVAELKIPFTTTLEEIGITNNFGGRVGSEGVFFSGLFTLSLVVYVLLLLNLRKNNLKYFAIFSLTLASIIATALMSPTPNVLRYTPVVALIPITSLVILFIPLESNKGNLARIGRTVLVLSVSANALLKLIPTISARTHEINSQDYLLTTMKKSDITYQVHTQAFYSSYVRLKEYGVKFEETDKLTCKEPHSMWIMFTTYYCP